MNRRAVLNVVAKYSVLYAGVTVLVVFFGSQLLGYAFGFAALVMLLGALVVVPLLFGASDAGLDTVEAGGMAGFQNVTDPSQYQPDGLSLPGKFQFGFYLLGIAGIASLDS